MKTPINGSVASRRNHGSDDLVVEGANSGSEDELPLPSSIHSKYSYEDTPPKGLLYSSPSGHWPKKTRKEKKKNFGVVAAEKSPSVVHSSSAMEETKRAQPVIQVKTITDDGNARNCIRPAIVVEDNVNEKIEEVARLQRRVAGLKNDLWALQQQVDINEAYPEGKVEDKVDTNGLLDIVLRYLGDEELCNQPATLSIPLSKSLTSFLPFAKPLRPTTPPPKARPPTFPVTKPLSYKSTQFDDLTPCLQFFTPLDFKQTISRNTETKSANLTSVQSHTITFCSPGYLLEGSIHMNYDTATESITRIHLLEISKWADQELGSWIREKISDGGGDDDDNNNKDWCNIDIIAWAMGRYWDLALSRAQCWVRCEKAHAEIVKRWAGTAENSFMLSKQKKNTNETKEDRRMEHSNIEEESADRSDDSAAASDDEMISKLAAIIHSSTNSELTNDTETTTDTDMCADADAGAGISTGFDVGTRITDIEPPTDAVSSHLGRQLLKLHGNGGDIELHVDYRIEFDWTGEVQSVVSADLAVPGPWRKIDERDALAKVPMLFQHLKKYGGVYNAVRVLLKLIYA